ncbi:MAG: 3-hydroxyacyl-CoA dehydrogenase family protein [Smithellaceae bacterium]
MNRIIAAIFREAEWMLEMEVASFEDIDKACVFGAGHPMGPFQLLDLTGIDLAFDVDMGKFKESGNFANLPVPSIVKLYTEGKYGQKTGEGFYSYKK